MNHRKEEPTRRKAGRTERRRVHSFGKQRLCGVEGSARREKARKKRTKKREEGGRQKKEVS